MITNMARYVCHKNVDAGKITSIEPGLDGGRLIHYQDASGQPAWVMMSWSWWDKHRPMVGGYLVQYRDGYTSYSPAQAFEEGYTRVEIK